MTKKETKNRLCKLSPRYKSLLVILVSMLVVGCVLSVYFKVSIDYAEQNYNYEITQIKELEWSFIEESINTYRQDAKENSTLAADQIRTDLTEKVASKEINEKFTETEDGLDILSQIASNAIKNVYLHNVTNDNNDLFVATREQIVSDLSINCAVPIGAERLWENEVTQQANISLANQAVDSIRKQSTGVIFWEFLHSDDPNHEMINSMSINQLKNVFIKEGLHGLSTYEFLTPAYIEDRYDILGKPDIDSAGKKTENDKVIVVQGFNIVDQLQNDTQKYQYYNTLLEKERIFIRENEHDMSSRTTMMIVVIGIVIILAVSLMFYINTIISRHE